MTSSRWLFSSLSLLAGVTGAAAQTAPSALLPTPGGGAVPATTTAVTNSIRFIARGAATPPPTGLMASPRPARAGLATWSYTPTYAGQPLSSVALDRAAAPTTTPRPRSNPPTLPSAGDITREDKVTGKKEVLLPGGWVEVTTLAKGFAATSPEPLTALATTPDSRTLSLESPSAPVSNAFPSLPIMTPRLDAGSPPPAVAVPDSQPATSLQSNTPGFLRPKMREFPRVGLPRGAAAPEPQPSAATAPEIPAIPSAPFVSPVPAPAPAPTLETAPVAPPAVSSLPFPTRRTEFPPEIAASSATPSGTVSSTPGVHPIVRPAPISTPAELPASADDWAQAKAKADTLEALRAETRARAEAARLKTPGGQADLAARREADLAYQSELERVRQEKKSAAQTARGLDEAMNRATIGALDAAPAAPRRLPPTPPVAPASAAAPTVAAPPAAAPAPSARRTLSLDDCLQEALRHNFNVQIQRLAPEIARLALNTTYGAYDPLLGLNATHFHNTSPGGNDIQGRPFPGNEITVNSVGPSLRGLLPFGATYDATVDVNQRDGTFVGASAQYSTAANLNLRQPLLRNFLIDTTRRTILVNKKDLGISEHTLMTEIVNTVTAVQQAYYDLIFSRENVKVQEKSLELAEQLLAENKKRVEVGVLAPLDEKQAESQVAIRRTDLLAARTDLQTRQNALKNLITDNFAQWQPTELFPAEQMVALREPLEVQASWNKGLTLRPEFLRAKLDVEKQDIHLKFFSNQRYPALDLVGSYGQSGLNGSLGNSVWDVRPGGDSPRYSAGVILSIPLSNREARNRYAQGKAEKQQSLLRLKQLEQEIMVQIDNSVKLARSEFERIDLTRKAREYAEAAVEAEQIKLANGKSTSFFVLQLQRDLTTARSAEIRSLADYNKAMAVLAQSEGTTLQRNKLTVEFR